MKKFYLVTYLFVLVQLYPSTVNAELVSGIQQKIDQIKQERSALLEEQQRLQATLNEVGKKSNTLQNVVNTLDTTRLKISNDLKITKNKLGVTNLTIDKLEDEISSTEEEISNHREAISTSLRKIWSHDDESILVNLLTNNRISEVVNDISNLSSFQDKLHDEIIRLSTAENKLLASKTSKEAEKKNLSGLTSELLGQKQAADETRKTQATLLLATKSQETQYQKLLADNIAQQKKFDDELNKYESQLKININLSKLPTGKEILSWPLEQVFITQPFGYTPEAAKLYKTTAHHGGIDLRADIGTPVFAAASGIVKDVEPSKYKNGCQYGRYVLIDHGNGLSTIYGHLSSVIVARGDEVESGETLGYSGATGYATGPHLHFGVYATDGIRIVDSSSLGSTYCAGIKTVAATPAAYLDPLAYLPNL